MTIIGYNRLAATLSLSVFEGSPIHRVNPAAEAAALADLCQTGKARVVLVGSGPVDLAGIPVEIRSWSEATEVDQIQGFDVGIMPVPDEPWEQGKCV